MGASYPTKLTLAARSGDRCAFPGCDRKLTVDGKFAKAAFTGQAAHIAGEKPDAARYDATMTAEQRDGVDNLIYLCRDHHDQIDKQEADFPVSLLLQWKKQHEDAVNTAMEGDSPLPLFTVPYPRHTCFKGRDDDLDNLRDLLVNGKKTALTQVIRGLGGIGKTQTAVEYAYRHKDDYKAILWVKAETELDIRQDMAEIARELKLADAEAKPDDAARALKIWLERTSDWLLVFDNADHPKLLKPVMPRASDGHVLLTSRASASEFDALHIRSSIELPLLSVDHAVEFLLERTERVGCDKGESDAARDLAEELGLLPIALEQAGAYIHELQLSFVGYLDKYRNRKQRLELLERGRPRMGDYPQSVATTWQVNFEEVEEESKPAADLFRLAAFLGPDNIPFELFLDGASAADCSSAKAVTESDDPDLALREALAKLERFSLVTVNGDEKTFSIHRLVQEAIKHAMNDADRRSWAERAVNMANEAAPDPEFEKWDLYRRLTRHAVAMLGHVKAFDIQTRAAGRLANQAGYFLYDQAEYAEAEPLYKQAMEIDRTALGEQHPDYATSLNNLAGLYRAMGRHTEAEPLYKQAMEIKRTALGEQHPGFAVSLNNLAGLYRAMGRHTEAEPLYKQAMEINRTALGEQHPSYATSLNNLAELYRAMGRHADAEPLYKQALEIDRVALGERHPGYATDLNNLALLYHAMGRHADAEPLYKQALAICRTALGEQHPDYATSLNNLAGLYRAMGRHTEAEPLYKQAMEIKRTALGEQHPGFAVSLNNLALLYNDMGRHTDAEPLYKQAMAICRTALGEQHPHYAVVLRGLAGLYDKMGRDADAAELKRQLDSLSE